MRLDLRILTYSWLLLPLQPGCANVLGLRDDYYVADGGEDSIASFELPPGKLAYHEFSDYYAGDARMWVVSLPDGARSAELGEAYELCSPLNANFSPDGGPLAGRRHSEERRLWCLGSKRAGGLRARPGPPR